MQLSPDGKQFVFSGVTSGRPVLVLYDVSSGKRIREIRFKDLGEILNPSWSPDGHSIAFSGLSGGLADLFIYDLQGDHLRRITDDEYSDLQPAWSPDGRTLAIATDRFSTDLAKLQIGPQTLGLVDVATGRLSRVPPTCRHGLNRNGQLRVPA